MVEIPKTKLPEPTASELKLLKQAGEEGLKDANAFMERGGWRTFVANHRAGAAAIPAVATFAALAMPNEKITKPDGSTEEHWGTGKKLAFGSGAAVTLGTLGAGHRWSRYVRIAEAEAKRVFNQVAHEI